MTDANWHPDPLTPGQERYWDGTAWTHNVRPTTAPDGAPAAAAAPAAAPMVAPAEQPNMQTPPVAPAVTQPVAPAEQAAVPTAAAPTAAPAPTPMQPSPQYAPPVQAHAQQPVAYGHPGFAQTAAPQSSGVSKWLVGGLAAAVVAVVVAVAGFALGGGGSAATRDVTLGAATLSIPERFRETDAGVDDMLAGVAMGAGPMADYIEVTAVAFERGNFLIAAYEMLGPADPESLDTVFMPLRMMGMVTDCRMDIAAPYGVLAAGSCEADFSDGPHTYRGTIAAFVLSDRLFMLMAIHDGGRGNDATVADVIDSLTFDMSLVDPNPPPLLDPLVPSGTGEQVTSERLVGSWGWDLDSSWVYEFRADGRGTANGDPITWNWNGTYLEIVYPDDIFWNLMPNYWDVAISGDYMTLSSRTNNVEYSYIRLPDLGS